MRVRGRRRLHATGSRSRWMGSRSGPGCAGRSTSENLLAAAAAARALGIEDGAIRAGDRLARTTFPAGWSRSRPGRIPGGGGLRTHAG